MFGLFCRRAEGGGLKGVPLGTVLILAFRPNEEKKPVGDLLEVGEANVLIDDEEDIEALLDNELEIMDG